MSITGPEGVNLDGITAGEFDLQSTNLKIDGYSGGLANIDDKDGLDNTCDVLLQRSTVQRTEAQPSQRIPF